jgi:hypothetical protein
LPFGKRGASNAAVRGNIVAGVTSLCRVPAENAYFGFVKAVTMDAVPPCERGLLPLNLFIEFSAE